MQMPAPDELFFFILADECQWETWTFIAATIHDTQDFSNHAVTFSDDYDPDNCDAWDIEDHAIVVHLRYFISPLILETLQLSNGAPVTENTSMGFFWDALKYYIFQRRVENVLSRHYNQTNPTQGQLNHLQYWLRPGPRPELNGSHSAQHPRSHHQPVQQPNGNQSSSSQLNAQPNGVQSSQHPNHGELNQQSGQQHNRTHDISSRSQPNSEPSRSHTTQPPNQVHSINHNQQNGQHSSEQPNELPSSDDRLTEQPNQSSPAMNSQASPNLEQPRANNQSSHIEIRQSNPDYSVGTSLNWIWN